MKENPSHKMNKESDCSAMEDLDDEDGDALPASVNMTSAAKKKIY